MNCPNDNTQLVMSDRQGIEIDYCPQCRGVWLDRGELDKILERSTQMGPATAPPPPPSQHHPPRQDYGHGGYHGHHKKRKESWLSEIFD